MFSFQLNLSKRFEASDQWHAKIKIILLHFLGNCPIDPLIKESSLYVLLRIQNNYIPKLRVVHNVRVSIWFTASPLWRKITCFRKGNDPLKTNKEIETYAWKIVCVWISIPLETRIGVVAVVWACQRVTNNKIGESQIKVLTILHLVKIFLQFYNRSAN